MKKVTAFISAGFVSCASVAMAALDATTKTAIQTGITDATADYYTIGGTILTVGAGIWAFRKVKGLIGV